MLELHDRRLVRIQGKDTAAFERRLKRNVETSPPAVFGCEATYNTRPAHEFCHYFFDLMFTPSQHDVRTFFCETYRKYRSNEILTPLEAIARDWLVHHPEYADTLSDAEAALAADYSIEHGQSNPFLHLSMHLSIAEQISIDQPPGIRAAFIALAQRLGSEHEAHHQIMECLGEMIWTSQRNGLPPDGAAYIECVKRR